MTAKQTKKQPRSKHTLTNGGTATVSLRHMNLKLWYKMGFEAKNEGMTTTQYVMRLLEKDLSKK